MTPEQVAKQFRQIAASIEADLASGKKPSRERVAAQVGNMVMAVKTRLDRRVEHDISLELDSMYPDIVEHSGNLSDSEQKTVDEDISKLWEFFDSRADSELKRLKMLKKVRKEMPASMSLSGVKIPPKTAKVLMDAANAADRAIYEAEVAMQDSANKYWSAGRGVEYWVYNTEDE